MQGQTCTCSLEVTKKNHNERDEVEAIYMHYSDTGSQSLIIQETSETLQGLSEEYTLSAFEKCPIRCSCNTR